MKGHSYNTYSKQDSLENRLLERAGEAADKRRPSGLEQIIALRNTIDKMQETLTLAEISACLRAEGIHLAEGSLRNYVPQVRDAVAQLVRNGVRDPTNDKVHEIVRRQRSGRKTGAGSTARHSLQQLAAPIERSRPSADTSLPRNPRNL